MTPLQKLKAQSNRKHFKMNLVKNELFVAESEIKCLSKQTKEYCLKLNIRKLLQDYFHQKTCRIQEDFVTLQQNCEKLMNNFKKLRIYPPTPTKWRISIIHHHTDTTLFCLCLCR